MIKSEVYRFNLKPNARLRDIKGLLSLECVQRIEGVVEGYRFEARFGECQTFNSNDEPCLVVYATAPIAASFMERYVDAPAAQAA